MELTAAQEEYAYRKHTGFQDGYDSDSSSGKSDFDEWYYINKPPPVSIENCDIVEIHPFTLVMSTKTMKTLKAMTKGKKKPNPVKTKRCKKKKSRTHQNDCDKNYMYKNQKTTLEEYFPDQVHTNKSNNNTGNQSNKDALVTINNPSKTFQSGEQLFKSKEAKRNKNKTILSERNSKLSLAEWPLLNTPTKRSNITTAISIDSLSTLELKKTNEPLNLNLQNSKQISTSAKNPEVLNTFKHFIQQPKEIINFKTINKRNVSAKKDKLSKSVILDFKTKEDIFEKSTKSKIDKNKLLNLQEDIKANVCDKDNQSVIRKQHNLSYSEVITIPGKKEVFIDKKNSSKTNNPITRDSKNKERVTKQRKKAISR